MLLFGGIGVVRRRQAGYVTLKRWAIAQIILALICLGLPAVILTAMSMMASFWVLTLFGAQGGPEPRPTVPSSERPAVFDRASRASKVHSHS